MNHWKNHFPTGSRWSRVMWLGMVFAVMMVTACGKKGPLYLPDKAYPPANAGEQTVNPSPTPPEKK